MPTTNLKIVTPASEHDAQKVTTLNTGTSDIDNVVAGMLTLSVAGTGDLTLTRAQGLNTTFKFTDVLTGNRAVLFPAALGCARSFLVWNATTGAFTLTVKTTTGGSTGVVVTQTKKVRLFHDGTNCYAESAEV